MAGPSQSKKEFVPEISFKNKDLKWQWNNPNNFYIYDVRETFWMNNQDMSIKEVLSYFVTKGGSTRDNSIYFRKL